MQLLNTRLQERWVAHIRRSSALARPFCAILACALLFALPTYAAAERQTPSPTAGASSSSEASLAHAEGKAESAVVNWVLANSGRLTGDVLVPDYRIGYTITPAEGWWELAGGGKLAWHEPPANSVHLRVFVRDSSDGRLVNGLTVAATVLDPNGNEQPVPLAFGWYPLINAYGSNVSLLADGSYRLRVTIVTPTTRSTLPAVAEEITRWTDTPARITAVEFPPLNIHLTDVVAMPLATATSVASEAKLLKPCNDALSAALTAVWRESASGAEKPSGDYFVGYALDDSALAGPLSVLRKNFGGREKIPVEVSVRDSRTGRPILGLRAQAELISGSDAPLDGGELVLLRRPWLNVYARNLRVARKGSYKLRISFQPPGFRRWGRQSERFARPGEVEFEDISPRPVGRSESDY
jgi:hypothetical protein